MAIIAAATAVFGMTASADDVKTAEIVLEAENAPYTYEDDNGEPAGYEYEVLKLIDDYLDDWTFNYTVLDYETALAGTTSGKYDLDSGCKFRTPAREEAFLVSNPYNYFFMNLVVKNDSGSRAWRSMDGRDIAPFVADRRPCSRSGRLDGKNIRISSLISKRWQHPEQWQMRSPAWRMAFTMLLIFPQSRPMRSWMRPAMTILTITEPCRRKRPPLS